MLSSRFLVTISYSTIFLSLAACVEPTASQVPATGLVMAGREAPEDGTMCGRYAYMSASIMELRQSGAPISKVMGVFGSGSTLDKMMRPVVVEAFDSPAFQTEGYQSQAVREFGREKYVECYKLYGNAPL